MNHRLRLAPLALLTALAGPAHAMMEVGDGVDPMTQRVEQVLLLGDLPSAPLPAGVPAAPSARFSLRLMAASGDTAPARQLLPGWCLGLQSDVLGWRDLQATLAAATEPEQIERIGCRARQRMVMVPQLSSDPGARGVKALLQGDLRPDELFLFVPLDLWQREDMARWPRERVLQQLSASSAQEALLLTRRLADPAGHAFFARGLVAGWLKKDLGQRLVFVHGPQGPVAAVFKDLQGPQQQRLRTTLRIQRGPQGIEAIGAMEVAPLGEGTALAGAPGATAPGWVFARDGAGRLQSIAAAGDAASPVLALQPAAGGATALRLADGKPRLYAADEAGRLMEFQEGKRRYSYFHHPAQPRLLAMINGDGCATLFERVDAGPVLYFPMFTEQCGAQHRFEQNAVHRQGDGRYVARQVSQEQKKIETESGFGSIDD